EPVQAAYARLITPAIKFAICKSAPGFLYEAMECLGGNGYVEESPLPRLYREAPVNAIWEGSGNIMALDVLRAARRDREATRTVLAELARQTHDLPEADRLVERIKAFIAQDEAQGSARALTLDLAALASAAALAQCAPHALTEAFARTRFHRAHELFGANELDEECEQLLERALPAS
ncbi:MAG: DNA alkylation response protein, partial [Hyphomicrobiales bacterium]|nr:DNA alkylation response protein [Hyphomicrobiales bacterium]